MSPFSYAAVRAAIACCVIGAACSDAHNPSPTATVEPALPQEVRRTTIAEVCATSNQPCGKRAATGASQRYLADSDALAPIADLPPHLRRVVQMVRGEFTVEQQPAHLARWRKRVFTNEAERQSGAARPLVFGRDLVPLATEREAFAGWKPSFLASAGGDHAAPEGADARRTWRIGAYDEPPGLTVDRGKTATDPQPTASEHARPMRDADWASLIIEACRIDLALRHRLVVLRMDSSQVNQIAERSKPLAELDAVTAGQALWAESRDGVPLTDTHLRTLCADELPYDGIEDRLAQWLKQDAEAQGSTHPANVAAAWLRGVASPPAQARPDPKIALDWQRAREWNTVLRHLGYQSDQRRRVVLVNIAQQVASLGPVGDPAQFSFRVVVGRNPPQGDGVLTPRQIAEITADGVELFPNYKAKGTDGIPHGPDNPLGALKLALGPVQVPVDRARAASIKLAVAVPKRIYLHGTNRPKVFDEEQRTQSHGCVRCPIDLWHAILGLDGSEAPLTCMQPPPAANLPGSDCPGKADKSQPLDAEQAGQRLRRALDAVARPASSPAPPPCLRAWCRWTASAERPLVIFAYFSCAADGACRDPYKLDDKALAAWQDPASEAWPDPPELTDEPDDDGYAAP